MADTIRSISAILALLADNTTRNVSAQDLRDAIVSVVSPIGSVMDWAGALASPPDDWLVCDGSSLLRADYPDLFAVIGTTFGYADSLHFNLPNLSNKFTLGADGSHAVGSTGGAASHSHTVASHSHGGVTGSGTANVGDHANHTHDSTTLVTATHTESSSPVTVDNNGIGATTLAASSNHTHPIDSETIHSGVESSPLTHTDSGHTHSISSQSPGTDSQGTIPPYVALAKIIRYQ